MKSILFAAMFFCLAPSAAFAMCARPACPQHVSYKTYEAEEAERLWDRAEKDGSVHYEDREDGTHMKQTGIVKYKGRTRTITCIFNRDGDILEQCTVDLSESI